MSRDDVRGMLLRRGWDEQYRNLLKRGRISVSTSGSDVFVTGPAKGEGLATVVISDVPARVIVALCESWADSGAALEGENNVAG